MGDSLEGVENVVFISVVAIGHGICSLVFIAFGTCSGLRHVSAVRG